MTETLSPLEILDFYALSGVDEVIADEPVDRLAVPPAPGPTLSVSPAPVAAAPAAAPLLKNVGGLPELREKLSLFTGCPLKQTAQNTVFGTGNVHPDVMIVGEAPGAEEDKQGLPFVGASGRLLDLMLASVGLSREKNVYITNVLPWRPPMNRKPSEAEIAACLPFLHAHIRLVSPKILLLLGGTALSALLHVADGITKTRGVWFSYQTEDGAEIPVMASFHPAYLLRSPAQKKNAWRDLQNVRDKLNVL